MHFKFGFLHEQFPRHLFEHPHFTSSLQLAVTSGRFVQNGCQPSVSNTQPYSDRDGKCGHGQEYLPPTMTSLVHSSLGVLQLCCLGRRNIMASFTLTLLLVLSYINMTTNRSTVNIHSSKKTKKCVWGTRQGEKTLSCFSTCFSTGLQDIHVVHADFFPLPANDDVVSHPLHPYLLF